MSGDAIRDLPINKKRETKPGDMELMYNIFQPKNIPVMKQIISPFKTAFVGTILFGILSLPFILKLSDNLLKNPIYSRLALMCVFLIIFFILTKTMK